jgi:PleD family two-component response regulator
MYLHSNFDAMQRSIKSELMSRTVIAAVDDMFFAAKIRAAADHLGITLRTVRKPDLLMNAAREGASLIIINLHAENFDPFALAQTLKADEQLRSIPLLGFFSHVQTELQSEAVATGYDVVIPRSVFSRDLGEILAGEKVSS